MVRHRITAVAVCVLTLAFSGEAQAQTAPVFTGPAGLPAVAGNPIKQSEVKAAIAGKQDVGGDIDNQHVTIGGVRQGLTNILTGIQASQAAGLLAKCGQDASTCTTKASRGTFARSLADTMSETANPFSFGAVCDGTSHPLSAPPRSFTSLAAAQAGGFPHATDLAEETDTAAIQEAAYSLSSLTGGRLLIPSACVTNRTIHITVGATTVTGLGGGSLYTLGGHNFHIFSNDAPLVTYRDFSVNPGGVPTPPSGSTPVYVIYDPFVATGSYGQTANYKMTVRGVTASVIWSGVLSGGGDDIIDQVRFNFFTGPVGSSGVDFDAPYVDQRQVWNSGIYGATYGVRALGSGADIDLINVELAGNATCFSAVLPANNHISSLSWNHVWCDSSTSTSAAAVFDAHATNAYIARLRIADSWVGGNAGGGISLVGAVHGTMIYGSQLLGNGGNAIDLHTTVGDTFGFSVDHSICAGTAAGSCLGVGAGVSNWSVTNSKFGPTADFGANAYSIYVTQGASDYVRIIGNDFHGNTHNLDTSGIGGTHTIIGPNL